MLIGQNHLSIYGHGFWWDILLAFILAVSIQIGTQHPFGQVKPFPVDVS